MKRLSAPGVALLLAFTTSPLAAQAVVHACTLLTPMEIAGAVGGTVGKSNESQMVVPSGPAQGQTTYACMWSAGEQGMVSVSLMRAVPGQKDIGMAKIKQAFETLKAQGWTEEKKDFGDIHCARMTPPAAQKNAPLSTGCFGEAKGMGLGVGAMGRKATPLEAVKTLFEKAAGRL